MGTLGLCTELPDFSCICKIGRTNGSDLALVLGGFYQNIFWISFFYLPSQRCHLREEETNVHFFPSSEGMLHPGLEGNIQYFWRKLLDFVQNN